MFKFDQNKTKVKSHDDESIENFTNKVAVKPG